MKDYSKNYTWKGVIVLLSLFIFTGCLPGRFVIDGQRGHNGHRGHRYHKAKKIPPGHMPPPGKCRIWYPGTPPGHQPPPGNCYILSRRVPANAWLIVG